MTDLWNVPEFRAGLLFGAVAALALLSRDWPSRSAPCGSPSRSAGP